MQQFVEVAANGRLLTGPLPILTSVNHFRPPRISLRLTQHVGRVWNARDLISSSGSVLYYRTSGIFGNLLNRTSTDHSLIVAEVSPGGTANARASEERKQFEDFLTFDRRMQRLKPR